MQTGRIFWLVSFAVGCGALGGGCASLAQVDNGTACIGPQCQKLDAGPRDRYVHDAIFSETGSGGESGSTDPLCGQGCIPDDPQACVNSPEPNDGGNEGAAAPDAGSAPYDAGSNAPSDAGDAAPAPARGCYVQAGAQGPLAVCGSTGSGRAYDSCISSQDCAAGYGCVNDGGVGVCLHFCCKGNNSCGPEEFCADRPLKDTVGNASPLLVPVCLRADNCNLAQPWPCTPPDSGPNDCTCKDPNTACMVVGDGLTSCIPPPGSGKDGDPCPCAWGYVCSEAQNTCLRICSLSASSLPCPMPYRCQSSPFMPDYFGVCAGTPLDASTR